jgi:hypothetical protein
MTARLAALTAATLALSGCYIDLGGEDEVTGGGWDDTRTPPMLWEDPGLGYGASIEYAVAPHHLSGDMGSVSGFDGHIYRSTAYGFEGGEGYAATATVQINSGDAAAPWAVMSLMNIQGGLDHPEIAPGAVLRYRNSYPEDSTALFITLLGCSGDAEGSWTFDQYADEVEVHVEEGATEGALRLDFRARFTRMDYTTGESALQYIDGSLSYTRP